MMLKKLTFQTIVVKKLMHIMMLMIIINSIKFQVVVQIITLLNISLNVKLIMVLVMLLRQLKKLMTVYLNSMKNTSLDVLQKIVVVLKMMLSDISNKKKIIEVLRLLILKTAKFKLNILISSRKFQNYLTQNANKFQKNAQNLLILFGKKMY